MKYHFVVYELWYDSVILAFIFFIVKCFFCKQKQKQKQRGKSNLVTCERAWVRPSECSNFEEAFRWGHRTQQKHKVHNTPLMFVWSDGGGEKKMSSRKTPATRTRVGKYELGKTVGEGSFAKVKFAKNVETGDNVAIKILDRDQVLRHKMVEHVITLFLFSLYFIYLFTNYQFLMLPFFLFYARTIRPKDFFWTIKH